MKLEEMRNKKIKYSTTWDFTELTYTALKNFKLLIVNFI